MAGPVKNSSPLVGKLESPGVEITCLEGGKSLCCYPFAVGLSYQLHVVGLRHLVERFKHQIFRERVHVTKCTMRQNCSMRELARLVAIVHI